MIHPELMVSKNLLNEFKTCTRLEYSGKLNIKSSKGHKWTFYYWLGRIVWATGGTHDFRRWNRLMAIHCPQIEVDKLELPSDDLGLDYWGYRLLEILYENQKIQREQINAVVESTIAELLFDLAQQANLTTINCDRTQETILEAPMSFTSTHTSLKLMLDSWKAWVEAGLASFSPDSSPVLCKPQQLQMLVSPAVYKNLVTFMDGKYTLRDLAVKMKLSVLPVTRSILPYILKGIIELVEVPDLPSKLTEAKNNTFTKLVLPLAPLIACVDDSPQVGQSLEQILIPNGLKLINIQDDVQALPILIEHQPDLIFLDLVMPVATGYEICAQLRRISLFAKTPIIILTDDHDSFDVVRAKAIGSTDFLTKPLEADQVLRIVRKYLHLSKAENLVAPHV
jgi:two-component system, chemotaxis family, response regulator PixG